MAALVHIAGAPIEISGQLRQRCGWCGMVLEDPENPKPWRPATWPVAILVLDGGRHHACGRLPHDLTGAQVDVYARP